MRTRKKGHRCRHKGVRFPKRETAKGSTIIWTSIRLFTDRGVFREHLAIDRNLCSSACPTLLLPSPPSLNTMRQTPLLRVAARAHEKGVESQTRCMGIKKEKSIGDLETTMARKTRQGSKSVSLLSPPAAVARASTSFQDHEEASTFAVAASVWPWKCMQSQGPARAEQVCVESRSDYGAQGCVMFKARKWFCHKEQL